MATIEQLEPRIQQREQIAGTQASPWRPPLIIAIRWGSVIAGVAVGIAVQLMLALLGIAAGLSIPDVSGGNRAGDGSLIWAGVSMLTSAFAGGYVAARMSGMRRNTDGVLHGAVSWAVSTILFVAIATSAGSALPGGIFTNIGMGPARSAQGDDSGLTLLLRGQLGEDISPADFQTLRRYIQMGQREEAVLLLSSMGMDPVRAIILVDQAMIMAGHPGQVPPQELAAGSRTIATAESAAWIVFIAVFLSLLLGTIGGIVGVMGSRRIIWKKEDRSIPRKNHHSAAT